MANILQDRYSKLVLQKMRAALVTKDHVIFNTRYEGSPTAGAVKIPTRGEASVGDYNKATGAELNTVDTSYITMTITKDKYVNEVIDKYDAAAVPDGILADRLDSAGYGLAAAMDNDGVAELVKSGTVSGNTTASTKSTAYDNIVDARTALSNAKVSITNRYLLVSPSFYSLILKNSEFIKASDLGQKILETGAIGQIAGFNVYECYNLGENVEFVAGHPDCATRANEFAVPVYVKDLTNDSKFIGACAVSGRMVYDHKVTHAEGIYVKKSA